MIGSDRDNFQTPEITKPEKCCENLIKMQNKIVEFEFSDDKICLIELVKIKLVSVLIKRGSVFCRVLSYTIKKCKYILILSLFLETWKSYNNSQRSLLDCALF